MPRGEGGAAGREGTCYLSICLHCAQFLPNKLRRCTVDRAVPLLRGRLYLYTFLFLLPHAHTHSCFALPEEVRVGPVTQDDVMAALAAIAPSAAQNLDKYFAWQAEFGAEGGGENE